MKHLFKIGITGLMLLFQGMTGFAQIDVADNQTALALVQQLTGTGVTVLNPVLTCPGVANGIFKLQLNGTTNLGIDTGIVLTSGRAMTVGGQQGVNGAQTTAGPGWASGGGTVEPDLSSLVTQSLHDVCKLEFDFVPAGDSIKFDYVFASTEYQGFSCSIYNDVFGFFISGPGFTTTYNMAVIPGTDIPITVNTTTGVPANPGPLCTQYGPGSPFSQYYVNNTGGTSITYQGFTHIFTAKAGVSACDTYHLKLAISDCSDPSLDSGVFLKAGSLTSTAITVKTFGGAGLETPFTNTVRGCPPGVVRIGRNGNLSQPVTIPLSFSGTAVNGSDYQQLPNSVTIPAGDSVVSIYVNGIPVSPAVGPKSCIISALSPYTCGNGAPIVLSSDTIMIYDSIYVNILNPDTAICLGESVFLDVEADSTLEFTWTPSATVSNPAGQDVTVTPTDPTNYTVSVQLPLVTGCPPSTDHVFIDVKQQPQVDLGIDKVTCGDAVQLYAATTPLNPDETFSWSPATGLSNDTIRDPVALITNDMQYIVTVNPGAIGCDGHDTVNVTLLPDHITVLNQDTVVCAGTVIQLRTDGDDHFSYNWTPEQDIANDTLKNTTLNAQQSGYYTLTASYPGCIDMPDSVYVEVQPVPVVSLGPDRTICTYDTIQLYASIMPSGYPDYSYAWTPGMNLTDSTVQGPVFSGDQSVNQIVKVTTPIGCTGSDTMLITVNPGDFLQVAPADTFACPPAEIKLHAEGAVSYVWSPSWGIDNVTSPDPVARPETTTAYKVVGTSDRNCLDTGTVFFQVYPAAVIHLPDSVTIWPGESYQMDPGGNALYFSWFPHSGMNAYDISNPIAQPQVRTRYFVTASTEQGCVIKDSIDVLVNTESVLDAPNAFTPGHGENGIFKVAIRGMAKLKYFRVYNRWGNKVFETMNVEEGWDGSFNGKPQPMGVYVYSIEAVTSAGHTFHKNGNVTLVR